jgi:hypothetical protein
MLLVNTSAAAAAAVAPRFETAFGENRGENRLVPEREWVCLNKYYGLSLSSAAHSLGLQPNALLSLWSQSREDRNKKKDEKEKEDQKERWPSDVVVNDFILRPHTVEEHEAYLGREIVIELPASSFSFSLPLPSSSQPNRKRSFQKMEMEEMEQKRSEMEMEMETTREIKRRRLFEQDGPVRTRQRQHLVDNLYKEQCPSCGWLPLDQRPEVIRARAQIKMILAMPDLSVLFAPVITPSTNNVL